MAHFKLKKGVYFVEGACRGAILNTDTGNVYSVNASAVAVITNQVQHEEYWQQLVTMGLAERCVQPEPLPLLPKMQFSRLYFIWFEVLSDDCNESCVHCYAGSMPPAYRQEQGLGIIPETDPTAKLSYQDWCGLILEGYQLGCRRGQFIGGEPFLYREGQHDVLDLAEYSRQVGYERIEIFTNATLLTKARIQRIKDLGSYIAVSLYSHDPEVHDSITHLPGSHRKTVVNLRRLKEAGVPTRVETVIMRYNQHTVAETQQLVRALGFGGKSPDPLRPRGRGDDPRLRPSPEVVARYGLILRPNFRVDSNTLARYSSSNSCLAGKVTITDTGDVLPCIFSRNLVIGNTRVAGSLEAVVNRATLQQIWNTTKEQVLVCQDCEYRYVCFDCRPLSEAAAQGKSGYLQAPYPRCSYDPYTGEWAKGVWRVDRDGRPYYDRSAEAVIQRVANGVDAATSTPAGH